MAKIASKYFRVDPWLVTEEGFDPKRARVSESVFSLANEFMGVRGYFEEGYSGDHLQGSYFGGLYENKAIGHPQVFKGLLTRENFIVNSVDWLHVRLTVDGETLDLAKSRYSDFTRTTDMRTGVMTRRLVWQTASGKRLAVKFERFVSMADQNLGCQRITLEALGAPAAVRVRTGLDFHTVHEIAAGWNMNEITGSDRLVPIERFWQVLRKQASGPLWAIEARTNTTRFSCASTMQLRLPAGAKPNNIESDDFVGCEMTLDLAPGKAAVLEKVVVNFWERPGVMSPEQVWDRALELAKERASVTFDGALAAQKAYWDSRWPQIDIRIDGDPDSQQGIRFDLFQMHMTYRGGDDRLAMPSKGLTAEVYSGWCFWVVDTYVQHMMIFTAPEVARKLLMYRYRGLDGARQRARETDCRGARYPFCTIDGPESCATWQHADMEIHVGVGIYRALELYMLHTDDKEFLYSQGIEMLLEICRYYASRGGWSPTKGDFGFYGVMGPDEYHTLVHHNHYTNLMGKKCFEYTLGVVAQMKKEAPKAWREVSKKIGLDKQELADWKKKARKMRLLQNKKTGLCEQHDRYFDMPEVDVPAIGEDQIPIYKHWAYERIFRMGMVKQADVLLLPVWFAHEWPYEHKKVNFEFYEPRTIHESSFSPSIHSILATELGRLDMGYRFFQMIARVDLDDYNKNTAQGLHMTPKSGSWMAIVYGFGGMRTDLPELCFAPSIPPQWKSYAFRIAHRGSVIEVSVNQQAASFKLLQGQSQQVQVYGRPLTVTPQGVSVPLEPVGQTLSKQQA
jgi:maltose phosphorylase